MKFNQVTFEKLLESLRQIKGTVYDNRARLFLGGNSPEFPDFYEQIQNVGSSYILYATINGNTLPLEHGMNRSLVDETKALEPPKDSRMPCAYFSGLAYHFDKPLEVLAINLEASEGIRPKWDIWMLRDIGESDGYINDNVLRALNRQH